MFAREWAIIARVVGEREIGRSAILVRWIAADIESTTSIQGGRMRVAKWGNSLAVRLPAGLVDE